MLVSFLTFKEDICLYEYSLSVHLSACPSPCVCLSVSHLSACHLFFPLIALNFFLSLCLYLPVLFFVHVSHLVFFQALSKWMSMCSSFFFSSMHQLCLCLSALSLFHRSRVFISVCLSIHQPVIICITFIRDVTDWAYERTTNRWSTSCYFLADFILKRISYWSEVYEISLS